MNIFGEPELGIDYIIKHCSRGDSYRLYVTKCSGCGKKIFKEPRSSKRYKNRYCNNLCQGKAHSRNQQGSGNKNWRGGITNPLEQLRKSKEYISWRDTIFGRDDYTCNDCGNRGGDIEAHHIYPVSAFPEQIFDVDNGITLCTDCHKLIKGKELEHANRYRQAV